MNERLENCGWEIHWLFLAVGVTLALIGGIFTPRSLEPSSAFRCS
jgi:hypothetical protein